MLPVLSGKLACHHYTAALANTARGWGCKTVFMPTEYALAPSGSGGIRDRAARYCQAGQQHVSEGLRCWWPPGQQRACGSLYVCIWRNDGVRMRRELVRTPPVTEK